LALPATPFEVSEPVTIEISSRALVRVEGAWYSTPSQQHRHRAIPKLHGDLVKRADRVTDPGVVVNEVKLTEFLDGALDCALSLGLARYVGFVEKGAAAGFPAFACGGFAPFLVEVGDDDGARPMPVAAPVITATLLSSLPIAILLEHEPAGPL
jgi:hypothetical protein